MKQENTPDVLHNDDQALVEQLNRYPQTFPGQYRILLSEFYDCENQNAETAEVSKEILLELLKERRAEKKAEIAAFRHCTCFSFDENLTAALEGKYERAADEEYLEQNLHRILETALNALTQTQKRRCELFYYERCSIAQIAKKEGVSAKTVRFSIDQALKALKDILGKLHEI